MAYAYGMQGSPAAGGGLPGLPRRGVGLVAIGGAGSIVLSATNPGPDYLEVGKSNYLLQSEYPSLFSVIGFIPDAVGDFASVLAGAGENVGIVLAGCDGACVFTTASGVYASLDNGVSFQKANLGANYNGLYGATDGNGRWLIALYSGASLKFARSDDNAKTWAVINPISVLGSAQPNAMCYLGNDTWAVAVGSVLHISSDFGNNWTSKLSGVTVLSLAANHRGGAVGVVSATSVYASTDYGNSWVSKALSNAATRTVFAKPTGEFVFPRLLQANISSLMVATDPSTLSAVVGVFSDGAPPDGTGVIECGSYSPDGAMIIAGAVDQGAFSEGICHIKLPNKQEFFKPTFAAGSPARVHAFKCAASNSAFYISESARLWRAARSLSYNTATHFFLPPLCLGAGAFKAYMRAR